MELVSVIIPNYNHSNFLKKRIKSVLDQTYTDIEVFVFDDMSSDNSISIIEEFRSHPLVKHIEYNSINSGSTFKQWEKGFKLAKGEFIWIAESDDYADPNFLARAIEKFKLNSTLGMVYCNSYVINEKDEFLDENHYKPIPPRWKNDYFNEGISECKDFLIESCTIPNASAVLFKTEVINKIGFDPKDFKLVGDWMFYIKILQQSDIYYISERLNFFRTHPQNVRSKINRCKGIFESLFVLEYLIKNRLFDREKALKRLRTIMRDSRSALNYSLSSKSWKFIRDSILYYSKTRIKVISYKKLLATIEAP